MWVGEAAEAPVQRNTTLDEVISLSEVADDCVESGVHVVWCGQLGAQLLLHLSGVVCVLGAVVVFVLTSTEFDAHNNAEDGVCDPVVTVEALD